MGHATARVGASVRWRVKVATDPLDCQPEPIPLLVPMLERNHALMRSEAGFRPLPDLHRYQANSRDVLGAGGRLMFFDRESRLEDPTIQLMHRRISLGIYRLRFSDLTMERANYEPRPGFQNSHTLGGSPDGERLLVARSWVDTPPGRAPAYGDGRVTVWLVGFSAAPARELFTFAGSTQRGGDNLAIQWSPDGTRIAFAGRFLIESPIMPTYRVLILDAGTGQEVDRVEGVGLAGSVSWSPDQTRLLVSAPDDSVWVHELGTDIRRAIPCLPGPRPDASGRGSARLLGYADNHNLMVTTQRGRTMTLSAIDLDSGEGPGLVRWTGTDYMYPVLAPMPTGYWS